MRGPINYAVALTFRPMPSELNSVVTAAFSAVSALLRSATAIEAVGLLPEMADTTDDKPDVDMPLLCLAGGTNASVRRTHDHHHDLGSAGRSAADNDTLYMLAWVNF